MVAPTKPFLLIDGDIFLYRCGFAVEKTKYLVSVDEHTQDGNWNDFTTFDSAKEAKACAATIEEFKDREYFRKVNIWSRKELEPVENAITALHNALKGVWDKFYPDSSTWTGQIYLTGKGNFREMVDSGRGYKDNRDPTHRPKHYKALKEYLINKHSAKVINGEEADDAIGRKAYSMGMDKFVVVSNDKDLDQISGFHYDWTKDQTYFVSDEDAIKFFYVQLLAGDSTDNIPGVMSLDKATAAIRECSSPRDCALACKKAYETKYGEYWGDKIEVIAELVWIRRGDIAPDERLHNPFWEHLNGPA